ncbi:hypothetical protein LPJ56_006607, partial [Coemansia sp. RSA 2599]
MFRQRGYARTKEDRARALEQLRHYSWLRGEDDGYSDFSEDKQASAVDGANACSAGPRSAAASIALSREEFLLLMSKHSAEEHFDSILFCIKRMACGLERITSIEAGNLNEMCRQKLPTVDLRMSMRLWTEFKQWTLVFGAAAADADIAADGIVADYRSPALRDKCIKQIRVALERSELRAEIAAHQERLPDMCWQCKQLAYAFVDSPVPQWLSEDAGPLLINNGSVRRAVKESGSSALIVGRRWLPMLQRVLSADQVLNRAAFAEFYTWRQFCILDYERTDILASQLHLDPSERRPATESGANGVDYDSTGRQIFRPVSFVESDSNSSSSSGSSEGEINGDSDSGNGSATATVAATATAAMIETIIVDSDKDETDDLLL